MLTDEVVIDEELTELEEGEERGETVIIPMQGHKRWADGRGYGRG